MEFCDSLSCHLQGSRVKSTAWSYPDERIPLSDVVQQSSWKRPQLCLVVFLFICVLPFVWNFSHYLFWCWEGKWPYLRCRMVTLLLSVLFRYLSFINFKSAEHRNISFQQYVVYLQALLYLIMGTNLIFCYKSYEYGIIGNTFLNA
jgi:hypothetical protein